MSNGGYKGASPARETSPEQYPGVWELTEQFQAQADGNWPFQADDNAPKSLRFDGSSAYLSRTLTASSNRRTWTMSMWVKRAKLGAIQDLFGAGQEATNDGKYGRFQFMADDTFRLRFWTEGGSLDANLQSTRVFRDCSAFYHFVIRHDSTETNQEDRLRIYVNGELITSYSSPDYLSQNVEGHWNFANKTQMIGAHYDGGGTDTDSYFDGYISEVHHIDGQSLPPQEFAFEDGQGIWQPKRFTGDYSSGPVYSNNFTGGAFYGSGSWAQAFDGKLTTGPFTYSSTDNTLTLPPGVTWSNKIRVYALRYSGVFEINGTDVTSGLNSTPAWKDLTATLGSSGTLSTIKIGDVGTNYVKLFAVELDDVILTDAAVGRNSFHLDFSDAVKDQSGLGNDWTTNNVSASPGYTGTVQFGSDSNDNSFDSNATSLTLDTTGYTYSTVTDPKTDTGSANAATVLKTADGTAIDWSFSTDTTDRYIWTSSNGINWTSTGTLYDTDGSTQTVNAAYVAWAGGSNASTLTVSWGQGADLFVDSPVNGNEASTSAGGQRRGNYATLSPLAGAQTLSNGNLDVTGGSSWQRSISTIAMSSGKYYWEYTITASNEHIVGVGPLDMQMSGNLGAGSPPGSGYGTELGSVNGTGANGSWNNTGQSSTGDVIGVAFDADAGNMYVYKNGTALNSGAASHTGLTNGPYFAVFSLNGSTRSGSVNFGQLPFKYQNAGTDRPSSDYKPLATCFLPEPSELAKNPSKAFDILLWSGNGGNSDRTISGIDMESGPDMVWSKTRNHGYHNNIFDAVRGFGASGGPALTTDYKDGQANAGVIKSTDSTSITWEKDSGNGYVWYNETGKNYVSWLWDAGTATTSVAVGDSNSLAYDQSQTWSSSLTSTQTFNLATTRAFDGNLSNLAATANATDANILFTKTFTNVTKLRVYMDHATSYRVRINGGNWHTDSSLGASSNASWRDLTSIIPANGTVNSIESDTGGQNNGVNWSAVEVNGRLLVDSGASVTNLPEVACDVRANPEAGFSIVKVDSPNSTEARAHGLSKAPDFIIAKATATGNTQHYHMFHSHFGKSHYATFTGDAWSSSDQWGSQEPNTHSFYVKSNTGSGANYAGGMIYYIWHAVENYSAMGSYVGNGVSDGPMVHLGWEPKWVLVKGASGSTFWRIWDATREPNNAKVLTFSPNSALAETTWSNDDIDFLSNGFKIRSNGTYHNSQFQTYLYVAFAANPFASNIRAH
jgi:hypothetical protein